MVVDHLKFRELLEEIFDGPTDLRTWFCSATPSELHARHSDIDWLGSKRRVVFELVSLLKRIGALGDATTLLGLRSALLREAPFKQKRIDEVFGIPSDDVPNANLGGRPSYNGHFLDAHPFQFGRAESRQLRDLLARTYRRDKEIEQLLLEVNVPIEDVQFGQSARFIWNSALEVAADHRLVRAIVRAAGAKKPALQSQLQALAADEQSVDLSADRAIDTLPTPTWKSVERDPDGLEKLLNDSSTLLDVWFLRRAIEVASGVVLLKAYFGLGRSQSGTAFRIGKRQLLTNHHVVFDPTNTHRFTDRIVVQLGFETMMSGAVDNGIVIQEDKPRQVASERQANPPRDWCVVELSADLPDDVAVISLAEARSPEVDDRAYIIQHPSALPKQVGLNRNLIRYVDDDVIQYLTDTMAGSSGSPVFNQRWELIGIHYRYIEAVDEVRFGFRNQGMRIGPVREKLAELGVELWDHDRHVNLGPAVR